MTSEVGRRRSGGRTNERRAYAADIHIAFDGRFEGRRKKQTVMLHCNVVETSPMSVETSPIHPLTSLYNDTPPLGRVSFEIGFLQK